MKTIQEMAVKAGFGNYAFEATNLFEVFAKLVREDERELITDLVAFYGGPVDLEAAIRARSNT